MKNPELLKKWVEFIGIDKHVSKHSSVCSQHFLKSDFSHGTHRFFLKKDAFPTILNTKVENQIESIDSNEVIEPLYNNNTPCNLCNSLRTVSHLQNAEENHFLLIKKCLPAVKLNNEIHKICYDCLDQMEVFSSFIDKVVCFQHIIDPIQINQEVDTMKSKPVNINIKVEPICYVDGEDDYKFSSGPSSETNWRPVEIPPPQINPNVWIQKQKCEILEIVDIKPFPFLFEDQETSDEDDIKILSPQQLKVEDITDYDEFCQESQNVLEFNRNYKMSHQDHNYVSFQQSLKQEYDFSNEILSNLLEKKKCLYCKKVFKNIKHLILHKIKRHNRTKLTFKSIRKKVLLNRHTKKQSIAIKINKNQSIITMTKEPMIVLGKRFVCEVCGKVFSGPKNLYQHKFTHEDTKKYICSLCNKCFKRSNGLTQHFRAIHQGLKMHQCHVCNHMYSLKADMARCRHSDLKVL